MEKDKPMESFTHEEYITAMKMLCKELPVTPETIQKEEQRRILAAQMAAIAAGRRREDGLSSAQGWELDRNKEAEEIQNEKERLREAKLRLSQSRKPSAIPSSSAPTSDSALPTSDSSTVLSTSATIKKAVDTPTLPSADNYVMLIGDSLPSKVVADIKQRRCTVLTQRNLGEASKFASQNQKTLCNVNTSVIVVLGPKEGNSELQSFLKITSEWSKPPPILVIANDALYPSVAVAHHPPYIFVATDIETSITRFLGGTQRDLSGDEETVVRRKLVKIAEDDVQERKGEVLAIGTEHDMRMRTKREAVEQLMMSLYWIGKDLDLSCILLSVEAKHIATVSFLDESYAHGCFQHSGDMMDGTNGVKESITVRLKSVPEEVHAMYFIVTSFSGESFSQIEVVDASLTLSVGDCVESFAEFPLGGKGDHLAMIMCRVCRTGPSSWSAMNLGVPHKEATTARMLVKDVKKHFIERKPVVWQ